MEEINNDFYITVLPNFANYCASRNWSMKDFIGKTFKVSKYDKFGDIDCYRLDANSEYNWSQTKQFNRGGWYSIPLDAAVIVPYPDLNPKEDSFEDDTNKWWLEESLSDKFVLDEFKIGDIVKLKEDFAIKSPIDQEAKDVSSEYGIVVGLFEYGQDLDDYPIRIRWSNGNEDYFYNVIDIELLKNYKKQNNTEIDPFDEENWGYVKENFKTGDIVKPKDGFRFELPYTKGGDGTGKITLIPDSIHCYVNWKNGEIGIYPKMFLEPVGAKILDLESDPFGEENWGYVKEQYVSRRYKVGDEVRLTEDKIDYLENYIGRGVGNTREHGIVLKIVGENECFIQWDNGDVTYYTTEYLEPYTKIRKLKNFRSFEDDYEDKDKWWLNENYSDDIRIGDIVEINKNHKPQSDDDVAYYKRSGEGSGIVKIFLPGIHKFQVLWNNGKEGRYSREELNLVGEPKKKKLNLEDDPFGEENWGFVQESHLDLEYNWIRVLCETKEEFETLLGILESYGYTWNSGHLPTKLPMYTKDYVLFIEKTRRKLSVGSKEKIDFINFKDFDIIELREDNEENDNIVDSNKWWLDENYIFKRNNTMKMGYESKIKNDI